jgi:hypothetical protein
MINVIGLLMPLFAKGWSIRDDGMIEPPPRKIAPDKPFRSANFAKHGYQCSWEMDVLFEVAYRMEAVPLRCHRCYKVLLAPNGLDDVLRIEAWQQAGDHPCKVGMEIRPTVSRAWGAYWYTNSITEGRTRYHEVKTWAEENLKNEWSILLKRGCTEYEQALGPSDKWEIRPDQQEIEDAIDAAVDRGPIVAGQPQTVVDNIHAQWRLWDKAMQPYVTYHHEKKEEVRRRRQLEARKK